MPISLGIYFLVLAHETGKRTHIVCSGLFSGLAMLVKTVALPQVLLLFLFSFFIRREDRKPFDRVKDVLSFTLPPLALALVTIGYFAWNGALEDFFHWNLTVPRQYVKAGLTAPPFTRVAGILFPDFILLVAAGVPAAIWLAWKKRGVASLLVALALPASFFGVWMPGKCPLL